MNSSFLRLALASFLAASLGMPPHNPRATHHPLPAQPTDLMQDFLDTHASLGPKPVETLTPEQARRNPSPADAAKRWLRENQGTDAPEPVGKVENRTFTSDGSSQPLRIYWPKSPGPHPVAVYWHGGGWVLADINTYDDSARALCNAADCIIISAEYRRAPEHKFPAAVDDAFAAYQWTIANATSFGGESGPVAVVGESAGGNLATVVALLAAERGMQRPAAQILIYPVTDYNFDSPSYHAYADAKPLNAAMMQWFFSHYLPDPASGNDWRASPLRAPAELLAQTPPATIITAEIDPLLSDGRMYAQQLERAGVQVTYREYPRVTHEFFGLTNIIPAANQAQQAAAQALKNGFNR